MAEPHPDRSVTILVAIADVDALVRKESALDAHAKHNTTSVSYGRRHIPYAAGKAVDRSDISRRRVKTASRSSWEMVIAEDGTRPQFDLFRALVRNHAKLAYNSVAAWLAGETPAPERVKAVSGLDAQLRLQDQVCAAAQERDDTSREL